MLVNGRKSKFDGLGPIEVVSLNNRPKDLPPIERTYNELLLTQENIGKVADALGGEIRRAWLYGEWVDVAIAWSQIFSINHRLETAVKTVFLGEYLEENTRTGFIHVLRDSLRKETRKVANANG